MSPDDTVGGGHGHGPNLAPTDVLLHFRHQIDLVSGVRGRLEVEGIVDIGQVLRLELHVEDGTDYLHHPTDVLLSHVLPSPVGVAPRRGPGDEP